MSIAREDELDEPTDAARGGDLAGNPVSTAVVIESGGPRQNF